MKVTNIDKDFIDIIDELNNAGFKPYASCDGVIKNHSITNPPTTAYISFLRSPQIIELMTAFLRDPEFEISISNPSYTFSTEYFGNKIEGNRFGVYFNNFEGEKSDYFKRIIRGIINKSISIPENEQDRLNALDKTLKTNDDNSFLNISVSLNGNYQPFTHKNGKINFIRISNKNSDTYSLDTEPLSKAICNQFNIPIVNLHDFYTNSASQIDEFIVDLDSEIELYINNNNLDKIPDIINYAKEIEPTLNFKEINNQDYDDYDF